MAVEVHMRYDGSVENKDGTKGVMWTLGNRYVAFTIEDAYDSRVWDLARKRAEYALFWGEVEKFTRRRSVVMPAWQ